MNGVRGSTRATMTSIVPPSEERSPARAPSATPRLPELRSAIVVKSSVDPLPVSQATARLVTTLNTETLQTVSKHLVCAPARLAVIAPLLSGATDAHKAKIFAEMGLPDVPAKQLQSAIDDVLKGGTVHTALWVRPDFTVDEDFAKQVDERLGTEIISTEPNALKGGVDGWSFGWTHGRLVDLVPEDALKDKQLVSTSAFPNDAQWGMPFNPANTVKEYPFDKADGSDPVAQVMMTADITCKASAAENYRAAELPLDTTKSFIVVVPAQDVSVDELAKELANPTTLKSFFASFTTETGTVYIPKMRLVGFANAADSFGPATKGPYEAVGSAPVSLGAALIATSIKLDETGISHAGGGSASFAGAPRAPINKKTLEIVECARPFLFMLRDNVNGLIVSAGIYRGP